MTTGSLILEQMYEDRLMAEGGLLITEPGGQAPSDRFHQDVRRPDDPPDRLAPILVEEVQWDGDSDEARRGRVAQEEIPQAGLAAEIP